MNCSNRRVMILTAGVIFITWGLVAWFSDFTAKTMAAPETLCPVVWRDSSYLPDALPLSPGPILTPTLTPTSIQFLALTNSSAQTPTLQMLIPLYSYPNWYDPANYIWDDVAAATCHIRVTAIINPDNGPGVCPPNSDYQHGLNDLRNAGVTILGYVYTSYGLRPLNEVKADVDRYDQCFNIHGIFFDEVASGANKIPYYKELYDYVKSKPNLDGAKVVLNPGTSIDDGYIKEPRASDSAIIFEGPSVAWPPYLPPPYVCGYPRERFAVLIHSVPDTDTMRSHINLAVARCIGYIYVTDDIPPNPYDRLPIYWGDEVSYIKSLNGNATAGRSCFYLPLILKNY